MRRGAGRIRASILGPALSFSLPKIFPNILSFRFTTRFSFAKLGGMEKHCVRFRFKNAATFSVMEFSTEVAREAFLVGLAAHIVVLERWRA
jgi:hypothetical protein